MIQLDTVAQVFDEKLPLQVENGIPFLKMDGVWECSDTTDEDRLQANILKYKKDSLRYGLLGVGMLINTLIFPYDNRREIRSTMESLDRELILFLEDLFDGDDHLPGAEGTVAQIDGMDKQLKIFAKQKLLMRPSRQKQELEAFRSYENKAMRLVTHMQVLCRMEHLGRLDDENRRRLKEAGANITDRRELVERTDRDIVTNYHVQKILALRQELLDSLDF